MLGADAESRGRGPFRGARDLHATVSSRRSTGGSAMSPPRQRLAHSIASATAHWASDRPASGNSRTPLVHSCWGARGTGAPASSETRRVHPSGLCALRSHEAAANFASPSFMSTPVSSLPKIGTSETHSWASARMLSEVIAALLRFPLGAPSLGVPYVFLFCRRLSLVGCPGGLEQPCASGGGIGASGLVDRRLWMWPRGPRNQW